MSAESQPITPARFAAALKDLPLSSLHLKLLELRNSIAHLDYSNEQLRPYAEGTATALSPPSPSHQQHQQQQGQPDQDCIDAIRENEEVIARMQERIRLVRDEVEARGLSWAEFQGQTDPEDRKAEPEAEGEEGRQENVAVNGEREVNGTTVDEEADLGQEESGRQQAQRHPAWSDGTFQTGVIRDGVVHMDRVAGSRAEEGEGRRHAGGSLADEELRRRMEEQLRDLGGDEDVDGDGEGGLHL
ncbi:hypothetical protein VTK56DRAFT_1978 [Thermocarpiscus australiensis]